jgi:hypothetical protein
MTRRAALRCETRGCSIPKASGLKVQTVTTHSCSHLHEGSPLNPARSFPVINLLKILLGHDDDTAVMEEPEAG